MSEWHWIALGGYVAGFFVTPYLIGRLTRGQGSSPDDADGCGLLATALTWPVWLPLVFLLWLFIGLPVALLKKGQGE